jgi:hypothetical protein
LQIFSLEVRPEEHHFIWERVKLLMVKQRPRAKLFTGKHGATGMHGRPFLLSLRALLADLPVWR